MVWCTSTGATDDLQRTSRLLQGEDGSDPYPLPLYRERQDSLRYRRRTSLPGRYGNRSADLPEVSEGGEAMIRPLLLLCLVTTVAYCGASLLALCLQVAS